MGKSSDYNEWISKVILEGHQDVYDLYNSVNNYESVGKFHTSKEVTNTGSEYLVKAEGNQDSLLLNSEEEKFSFLQHIADEYTDSGDGSIETWYKLKKELNNID
jgi:hypothetical protein